MTGLELEESQVVRVDFSILDNFTIQLESVINNNDVDNDGIVIPEISNRNGPIKNGVIDSRLGVTDNFSRCETCGLNTFLCPGHFGHIRLGTYIYHKTYLNFLPKLLSLFCIRCSKLLAHLKDEELNKVTTIFNNKKKMSFVKNISKNISYCFNCGAPVFKINIKETNGNIDIVVEPKQKTINENIVGKKKDEFETKLHFKHVISPEECYNILSNIDDNDYNLIGIKPHIVRPEHMIMTYFPVPPLAIRPSIKLGLLTMTTMDDDLTQTIVDIVKFNEKYKTMKENNNTNDTTLQNLKIKLYSYYNNETSSTKIEQKNGRVLKSVISRLGSKSGRIRHDMMGKRVNGSARTVITSEPNIRVDELGVPLKIAMDLTYPEIVNENNIEEMKKIVLNGMHKYPGANTIIKKVVNNDGTIEFKEYFLEDIKRNVNVEIGDVIERHLITGDPVLFNRQPSLHKLSMMCHRIQVIEDPNLSTFRMNVSATKPYNADYDGRFHCHQQADTFLVGRYTKKGKCCKSTLDITA